MSDAKIRREVLVGSLLLVIGLFLCIIVGLAVHMQIDSLNLNQFDARSSMNNLAMLLTLLAVACLFFGAVSGYIIGKYRHS